MNDSNDIRTDAQLELEALSVEMGVARYRAALAEGGHGEVPAGQQLLKAAMRPMADALEAWLKETGEGVARRGAGVYHFINSMDPLAVSWCTAHAAINMLHERPPLPRVATALALNLEATINVDAIVKANKSLGAKVAKRASTITEGKNRLVFIRKGAELADVKAIQWDDGVRLRVGVLLLEMFAQSTELVTIETSPVVRGRSLTTLRPTESCLKWLEHSHARCELLAPTRLPMVCPPRKWTGPFNGGYLTKALRQPIVKTRNRGYLTQLKDWDMPGVYASVNALQETEWAVNEDIYGVMKALWESDRTDGGLPQRVDTPLPSKAWGEGETPEEGTLHAWKVSAARTYEANGKLLSKRLQLVQKLLIAEMMLERGNRFHYVYNLDWRGRLYPVGPSLTPQGDDAAKGLLCFAKTEPLGETGAYWLAIHGANSFGVDKVTFEERIEWVEANNEAILAAANDPCEGSMWWTEADSPFVFLAFCQEWAKLQRWVDAGISEATFQSSIAVAFDGSCNGLQNFSAMLLDEVGGAATGLIPNQKPADVYSEVAKAAQVLINRDAQAGHEVAPRWVGKMTRKLAKRNTMTVPYGVTKRGMRDQLFGELRKMASDGQEVSALPEDADYLAACNFEAIGSVVVAARQAMDWLREAAKVAASNKLPVRWETPMGFLAVQDYRLEEGDEVDFTALGRRFRLVLQRTGDKLNTRKQALGISPNFVHSLDAAHLMRTVLLCSQDGMRDFAMIHDSYGCHAGRAALLRDNLRDAFVDQYREPVLQKFRDELLEQLPEELRAELPPLPPMGSLDLELVRQSEYFFA